MLRVLAEAAHPVSAAALTRTLGIPRSSTFQLLKDLVYEGLVTHLPEAHGYMLGEAIPELAASFSPRDLLRHLAQPLLEDLSKAVGGAARLAVLHEARLLVLHEEGVAVRAGTRDDSSAQLPSGLGAVGSVLVAALPPAELRAWLRCRGGERDARADVRLVAQLQEAAGRGWCVRRDEPARGWVGVAAGVRDRSGRTVAGISVAVPPAGVHQCSGLAEAVDLVRRSARGLSFRLGWDGGGTRAVT